MAEKPGWYPDPDDRPNTYRWWTGRGWTRWLADSDDGPPPQGHDDPRVTAAVVPRGDRQVSHTARTIVVGIAVLVLVLVVAAIGGAITNRNNPHPDSAATPADLTAGPSVADAVLDFDAATRTATFGTASAVLPEGDISDINFYDAIDPMVASQTGVPQPSGAENWVAFVSFGSYAGPLQTDLRGYAEHILAYVSQRTFAETETSVENVRDGDLGDLPADRAYSLRAEVHFDAPEGDAQRDEVEIVVIQVNPAQRAVWVSMTPENTPPEVLARIEASRASLRVN